MALRMVALKRIADGRWFARKVIPKDVCEEYQRYFGHKAEAHLKLPADTPKYEAKARLGEWEAEVETRIATLRAQRNGEGQPLTKLNAVALAGRWYSWFLKQHEGDPGKPKFWRDFTDHVVWNVLRPEAPSSFEEDTKADKKWDWTKEPAVRDAVRPQIAELARIATFLASEGKALNPVAHTLFVDAVSDNLLPAIALLERRANGDYSHHDTPDTFPPFTEGPAKSSGVGCWELFEAFVHSTKIKPNTVSRWRAVFLEMQREFAEVGADGITEDAARSWMHGLINGRRTAKTVNEIWLSASRRVFGWAREHKRIRANPFKEVKVDVPRTTRTREEGRSFSATEVVTILNASLSFKDPKTATDRTRRWVPWLCAYSGARAGEITQLRGKDIEERGGIQVMILTPDAGTTKTGETRIVPLHEHLLAQGFIEFVSQMGKGALFYNDRTPQRASNDPLKPSRRRSDTARAKLGEWVRDLGVDDPGISPNHAWRHTFKRIADEVGMPEKMNDAITGHTQATEGRKYGAPTVAAMAAALTRFPRYKLD
jgi:integrase